MAVIPWMPGLEVTVEVAGATADEHQNPNNEPQPMKADQFDIPPAYGQDMDLPYVVKYIEAVPDQPFHVHVIKEPNFRKGSHHIAFNLHIDAGLVVGLAHDHDPCRRWDRTVDSCCSGKPATGYKIHKFQFASLGIAELTHLSEEDLERQRRLAKRCGILKVAFFRMRHCDPSSAPCNAAAPALGLTELAEKAMKGTAADCSATFTSEPLAEPPNLLQENHCDPKKRPFAIFEFRYRSREGLMNEGVIPRPTIAEQVEGMNDREIRQRLTQMMENERSAAGSSQQTPPDKKVPRGIKREAEEELTDDQFMARYKARRLENGKMQVDLTDD